MFKLFNFIKITLIRIEHVLRRFVSGGVYIQGGGGGQ